MNNLMKKLHLLLFIYFAQEVYFIYDGFVVKENEITSSIPNLEVQIKKNERKKKDLKKYFEDIEGVKKRIDKVAQEVESLGKKFPDKISDTENLGLLRDIAESINIKNIFLSPANEALKGFYYSKNYNFKGTGTYLQFLVFLEKVATAERILNVKSVDFLKNKDKQKGRFQLLNAEIAIEAYRYNPRYKENRGFDDIEKQFKDKKSEPKKRTKRKKKS